MCFEGEEDMKTQNLQWEHITNLILSNQDSEFRRMMIKLEKDKKRRIKQAEGNILSFLRSGQANYDSEYELLHLYRKCYEHKNSD